MLFNTQLFHMIKQQMLPQIRPPVKKRDVYSEGKKKDSGSLLATERDLWTCP